VPAVYLVLTLCAFAHCEPEELAWDGSLISCMFYGQPLAVEWIKRNAPAAELRRWQCVEGRST
jgi:hypothetical protein